MSNASDALDKIRFISLSNPEYLGDKPEMEIKIDFNHEEKTYGGCYQFESKAALDAYMAGDVFKMIMENPDWSDHMVRSYEVHAEATEIQKQAKANAA